MFDFVTLLAAADATGAGWGIMGAGIGAGLAAIGAALGLGKIAAGLAEGIARQPEAAGKISGPSLLMAFLVEGVALFACVICILGVTGFSGLIAAASATEHPPTGVEGQANPGEDVSTPGTSEHDDSN